MGSVKKNGGWETERKKKREFSSAREAVPSQTYPVLSVMSKVCVLME